MAVATAGLANNRDSILARLSRYSDLVLAAAVCAVVGMMIVPLPEWLLDLLIITNLALGLVMLMVAVYARDALQFSVFPSLLLLTTLFRLGLDISATRLILLQAHAGEVVKAFGDFVVGGNFVVGVVIFLILIVVNFVVITNGAGRVAEVAARFTLDAMPGKQMAIDAELNAGAISDEQARARRQAGQQPRPGHHHPVVQQSAGAEHRRLSDALDGPHSGRAQARLSAHRRRADRRRLLAPEERPAGPGGGRCGG